ncbi:MAG: aldo/keto reductase [Anaerolineales bacterium]|nr:aldo/keto reductase [Anaerolineales bacterium]
MQYTTMPGIDKPVSRIVQGTIMLNFAELDENLALLDAVWAHGCTAFDTAHIYRLGECERVLGRWINSRGLRDQVVVIGKGAHHNEDRRRVTPFDITADLFDSLARQQTDYIDLYLLHRDDPSVPVGPLIEVLNEHLAAGRIRAFGSSNWRHERIEAANAYAEAHGLISFAAHSPHFSLAVQQQPPWPDCVSIAGPEQQIARDWYAHRQIPLFVWSSLAGGFFSGRFRRDNLDSFTSYYDQLCVQSYCTEDNFQRLERANILAEAKQLSAPQVALAYVLNQPLNIFALVGCRTEAEFQEVAEAAEMGLSAAEVAYLFNGE